MNRQRDSLTALTRAFLARYFESELTTGLDDLKNAFFWLLAALAAPGLFLPWLMSFDWQLIGLMQGPLALRELSRGTKVFYLGWAMIASGLLTTIVWGSLLPDRRDALILGAMPVRPATVVRAKLLALGGYILMIAVAMHLLAAVFFGALLSIKAPGWFLLRGIAAHFAAAAAASAAVAVTIAAAQGLLLAAFGPRWFRPLSTLLQVSVAGLIATGIALLPWITAATVPTIRGFGRNMQPWILSTPPVWFLGLYEWLLGSSEPAILALAQRAALTLIAGGALVALTFPLAYRRLLVSVVEAQPPGGNRLARTASTLLARLAGRQPPARGAAAFFVATAGRVERHRLVVATGLGLGLACALFGAWAAEPVTAVPDAGRLALPLALMMLLIVALRIAASLPGDVRAAWVFDVHSPSRAHARQALERMIATLGVLPPVAVSTPVFWWLWGGTVAMVHAAITLTLGVMLVEVLLWRLDGMPCGQQWNPARLNLGRRWPLYVGLFLAIVLAVPRLELLVFERPYLAVTLVGLMCSGALATRHASATHQIVPSYDDVDPVAGVLRLQ